MSAERARAAKAAVLRAEVRRTLEALPDPTPVERGAIDALLATLGPDETALAADAARFAALRAVCDLLLSPDASHEASDAMLIEALAALSPNPEATDLLYHRRPPLLTVEAVERMLAYEPIRL